jgi:hypothetical protein
MASKPPCFNLSVRLSPKIKSRLTTIAIILATVSGTTAIFGVVPLIAYLNPPQPTLQPAADAATRSEPLL